jgi:two-component system, sensor histidine kinase PdtaS
MAKAKDISQQIRAKEQSAKLAGLQIKYKSEQQEARIEQQQKETELARSEAAKSTYQLIFSVLVIYLNRKINIKNHQLVVINSALVRSTEQKQTLLKEVHHRVKNNLTTLKSLFYLQAKSSASKEVREALEECQQQIHSMALIHQNMYEATESEKLDFFKFLKQLMRELETSRLPTAVPIQVSYHGESIDLDVSTALFLSLMVNELATNSYKHAFIGRQQGDIVISLRRTDNLVVLIFSDNGIGLPTTFESTNGNFGFKLLHIMADQVQARMNYVRETGNSVFSIEIPYALKV